MQSTSAWRTRSRLAFVVREAPYCRQTPVAELLKRDQRIIEPENLFS